MKTTRRKSPTERKAMQRQSLERAVGNNSTMNYETIFVEFTARGIPAEHILPRVNVLSFNAWKAVGRFVRKGEKGVKVVTWVPCGKEEVVKDGKKQAALRPVTAYVFHVSQTDPAEARSEVVGVQVNDNGPRGWDCIEASELPALPASECRELICV